MNLITTPKHCVKCHRPRLDLGRSIHLFSQLTMLEFGNRYLNDLFVPEKSKTRIQIIQLLLHLNWRWRVFTATSVNSLTFCFKFSASGLFFPSLSPSPLHSSCWRWRRYFTPVKLKIQTGCCCRTTTARLSRSTTGSSSAPSVQVRPT